jgi:hypothetical protein
MPAPMTATRKGAWASVRGALALVVAFRAGLVAVFGVVLGAVFEVDWGFVMLCLLQQL